MSSYSSASHVRAADLYLKFASISNRLFRFWFSWLLMTKPKKINILLESDLHFLGERLFVTGRGCVKKKKKNVGRVQVVEKKEHFA